MFPFRTSAIFKNRWLAALWAAGFIWLALEVAGPPDASANAQGGDGSSEELTAEQAQQVGNALDAF